MCAEEDGSNSNTPRSDNNGNSSSDMCLIWRRISSTHTHLLFFPFKNSLFVGSLSPDFYDSLSLSLSSLSLHEPKARPYYSGVLLL